MPRSGRATTAARFGNAAVLCGKAIASTKCSWKRGSTAVSIFSTRRTTAFDLAPRRARQERDERAGPGRVAGRPDVGEVAVGDEPEDHRVDRVDLAAEGAGQPDLVELVDRELVHQQPDARVERGLGQLDGPDVVLGDGDARAGPRPVALVEDVAEGPTVGDDPRRACRQAAVDDAVLGDDAGQEHLGDDLDDARAADAGDAGLGDAGREGRLVRPGVHADDPEARLERLAVDPDALDGARRGALAAGDLGALEGRTGRARGGEQAALVAEDDLGVRADVDDQRHPLGLVRLLGQDDAGGVRADVPGDARQDVDPRARVRAQAQLGGGRPDRPVRRQRERRAAERRRVDAEQEVVHDRVADDRQLEDLGPLDAGPHRQRGDEPVERLAHRGRHLAGALGMHHRVRDAAHEVLAEADLRVHDAVAGEDGAVGEVGEVTGDRRRTDVDGDAVGGLVEARPDADDLAALVDRDGDPVRALLEGRLERADDLEVRLESGQLPLALERLEQPGEVARRRRELRRRDLDVVEADDRVDDEVADVEALADDLAVDLALGRDVDEDVAADLGRARQAPVRRQALLVAVGRLERSERREVPGLGHDAVLRELAESLGHLAAAADAAPAADRIDVHAERARRVEDRGPGLEPAATAGRREDDERVVGHRERLPSRPRRRDG